MIHKPDMVDAVENMRIWNRVETTDTTATKSFTGAGGFKGTAIKPTYLMRKATEIWGPVGEGWGWSVLSERFDEGGPLTGPTKEFPHAPLIRAVLHTCHVQLWYLGKDGKRCEVEQYGQTAFVHLQKGVVVTDFEAVKKSLTDGIGKCLQPLGFAADVYMGMFDDGTYVEALKAEERVENAVDKVAEQEALMEERLKLIASTIELMNSAGSLQEAKKIHDSQVRRFAAKSDTKAVLRLKEELDTVTKKFGEAEKQKRLEK